MSGWLYEDKSHGDDCQCDACDGKHYIYRHVPDDCLFDEETHRGYNGPRQRRKRYA